MFILVSCGGNPNSKAYIGAEAGPIDIKLEIDSEGHLSVAGDIVPRIDLGLIDLKVGIEETLDLTKDKPYTLFIIWKDENGNVQREEYEIGKPFTVTVPKKGYVQVQGDNDSVIVTVEDSTEESSDATAIPSTDSYTSGTSENCSNTLPSKLQIGDKAEVVVFQVSGRDVPGINSTKEHVLAEGRVVTVLDGPQCVDNIWWWKIHFAGTISTGEYLDYEAWMPEADNDMYDLKAIH
jgi:hypothetical protein